MFSLWLHILSKQSIFIDVRAQMKIKIKKLNPDTILPSQAHPGDAGFDVYSQEEKILVP